MTWKFWKAALIRALRTFAQSLLAVWGTGAVFSEIPWLEGLSAAGVAALLSLLTSIATGLPEVENDV